MLSKINTKGVILPVSCLHENSLGMAIKHSEEEFNELKESIAEHGIIEPIHVRKRNGRYEVVSGYLRWKAAEAAGLEEIPAFEECVWMELISYDKEVTVDKKYYPKAFFEKINENMKQNLDDNKSDGDKLREIRKKYYKEILEEISEKRFELVEIELIKFDLWEISWAIEEVLDINSIKTNLDILFRAPDGLDEEKINRIIINFANEFDWYSYKLINAFPNGWAIRNGWMNFQGSLQYLQIKKDGTVVKMWEEWDDKTVEVNLMRDISFESFYEGLYKLDRGDWLIGCDFKDICDCVFRDETEVYYFEWFDLEDKVETITLDVNRLLGKYNLKIDSHLFWIYGNLGLVEFSEVFGDLFGDLFDYDDYRWGIDQLAYDDNATQNSYHLILICKKVEGKYAKYDEALEKDIEKAKDSYIQQGDIYNENGY